MPALNYLNLHRSLGYRWCRIKDACSFADRQLFPAALPCYPCSSAGVLYPRLFCFFQVFYNLNCSNKLAIVDLTSSLHAYIPHCSLPQQAPDPVSRGRPTSMSDHAPVSSSGNLYTDDLPRKRNIDTISRTTLDELPQQLQAHAGFGLFTICCYEVSLWRARGCRFSLAFLRNKGQLAATAAPLLAALLLAAQVAIPVLLFIIFYMSVPCPGRSEWFTGNAGPMAKTMMFFVSCVYTSRVARNDRGAGLLSEALNSSGAQFDDAESSAAGNSAQQAAALVAHSKFARTTGIVDSFLNTIYEQVVYLINLWLVFTTSDTKEMLTNALALEFIMQLDNEFVDRYWTCAGAAATYIIEEIRAEGASKSQALHVVAWPVAALNWAQQYFELFTFGCCFIAMTAGTAFKSEWPAETGHPDQACTP
ncbi:hypothetical protein JKP88DRAFT_264221 [Tribonema minus]|uniref:Uncharacterized protein n=1 Tax=Tribonema minus TaxID=303371 RepID=A0A835YZM3_9STRA|nr:hypothetical protein JKP88DRAFT_264221 [Tribonema minus]